MHKPSSAKTGKPLASLSLDLDNQWAYMKTHGDKGWESFPSYLSAVVPRTLKFLEARGLTITFFIVGQDAALDKNHEALAQIAAAGHEIGNHSFNHEPWLHLYSEIEIHTELARAEEHIEQVTGYRPIGFRGPGFSSSPILLTLLAQMGYQYDASTFPTFLGPLARAYYFMTARLDAEEKQNRKALFGNLVDGFQPIKPYCWKVGGRTLVEIPVTTMPFFKVPIHASYLLYLSLFSKAVAMRYFRTAMELCRWTGTQPSLLLHPLDFLGSEDDIRELKFFPAMKMPSEKKLHILSEVLLIMEKHYSLVNMKQHADDALRRFQLGTVGQKIVNLGGNSAGAER